MSFSTTANTSTPTLWETLKKHASNLYNKANQAIQRNTQSTTTTLSRPASSVTRPVSSSGATYMTPRATTVYGGKRRRKNKTKKGKRSKSRKSRRKKTRRKH